MVSFSRLPMVPTILLIYLHLPLLVAVQIGDVFTVKSGTTSGGCDSYSTQLAQFWTDSQKLAQAGADAITDASAGDAVALAHLAGYFGINTGTTDQDFGTAMAYMNEINTFFQGGGMSTSTAKPFLFCNSDWIIEYQRTDVALNDQGQPWTFDEDGILIRPSIEDIPKYRKYLFDEEGAATDNVPYWSSDLNNYIFNDPSDGNSYCSNRKNLGATQTGTEPRTVTLCVQNIISNRPARDAALGTSVATVRKFVKTLVPQAATLFHEVFHVVKDYEDTPDAAYSLTIIQNLIKSVEKLSIVPPTTNLENPEAKDAPSNIDRLTNKGLILRNPETYTFFATAYWVYQNSGKTVTLATGQVRALSS